MCVFINSLNDRIKPFQNENKSWIYRKLTSDTDHINQASTVHSIV